jgi:hypothetical protein
VAFNRLPPHLLFSLDFVGPRAEEFRFNISPLNILLYFFFVYRLGFRVDFIDLVFKLLNRFYRLGVQVNFTMLDCVDLVEKVADKVITPAPPPPPDKCTGHRMARRLMDNETLATKIVSRPPPNEQQ